MARYKKRADGLYQKQITITVKGKKKQKAFYAKTIPELERKVREYQLDNDQEGILFSTVSDDWWKEHEPTLSPNSIHGYVKAIEDAKKEFGDQKISKISALDINTYLLRLKAQKFSYKTVSNRFLVIRQIFSYAVLYGYIPINVTLSVSVPRGLPRKQRQAATDDDINRIRKSNSLIANLALYTGCRRGELLALTYDDINWEDKEIYVTKSVYFENNRPYLKEPKTEAGKRTIPLLKPLENLLKEDGKGPILNLDGKMLTDKQARTLWDRTCEELGISCTLHQLRHAFATRLYDIDIDVKSAQQIMGHADISTTQKIYTHLSEERKKQTLEKLKNF